MSGEADEAAPSTSAAAAAAASSSLRAPDGMAFAVEHNASDNSQTLRRVPGDEAAQRWSTAQSQSSVSTKPGKETSSLSKILFTETQFQVGRWLCSFVIMFAGVAVVAKHPFMRISRFTTFNIALASLHSVSASLLVLPNASPHSAKPTMTYAFFVFVDFIVNFAASFLMIPVRASEKTMASNIAFFARCISLFTCLGSVACVIYRCKSEYSAKDCQGLPEFYRRGQNGQRTDDVELDTFRRSGDSQSHPDGGVEGEPSETASVHSFKGDDNKITNHLAAAFRSISRMHAFQTVLALAIFAISAAVAAQHPDIHHYASATNTFIFGVICVYLPFITVTLQSPSSVKINTWYLVYVISSVIFTSLANVFMWHIYATDQYLPAFFAGWAGAIIAFLSAVDLNRVLTLDEKQYSAEEIREVYWDPPWHEAYFDGKGGRVKFLEHGDVWMMQMAFSVFTLFFCSYHIALRTTKIGIAAIAFNLAVSGARSFAILSGISRLAPVGTEGASTLYVCITTANFVLITLATISAFTVRPSDMTLSIMMIRLDDIGTMILVVVDIWMTIRSRKQGHDYQQIDSANEGILEDTFAVGEDEEEDEEEHSNDGAKDDDLESGRMRP